MVGCVNLNSHLRNERTIMRKLRHSADFMQVVRQGFLAVNVFAQLHRAHGNRRMHVIGCRDINRINIFSFGIQQLPPVLINLNVREPSLQFIGALQVHFRHRHKLQFFEFCQFVDVRPCLPCGPKTSMAHHAVG